MLIRDFSVLLTWNVDTIECIIHCCRSVFYYSECIAVSSLNCTCWCIFNHNSIAANPGNRLLFDDYQFMLAIMPFWNKAGYLNIHIMPSSGSLVNITFSPVCWLAVLLLTSVVHSHPPFLGGGGEERFYF